MHIEEKVKKDNGYAVTVEDLQAWEAEHGEFPEGCFVALSTGWYHKATDQATFENRNEAGVEVTPGWSTALEYLSRVRNVQAIGHENIEHGFRCGSSWSNAPLPLPAQRFWLTEDKYQVEMLKILIYCQRLEQLYLSHYLHVKGAPAFAEVWAVVP